MTNPQKGAATGSAGGPAQPARSGGASSREAGLSTNEATQRLAQEGPNDVPEKKAHPLLSFAGKFWNLSAWMIELIALVSLILHKWADLWIALLLLVVNAVLSFLQEQRAVYHAARVRRGAVPLCCPGRHEPRV